LLTIACTGIEGLKVFRMHSIKFDLQVTDSLKNAHLNPVRLAAMFQMRDKINGKEI